MYKNCKEVHIEDIENLDSIAELVKLRSFCRESTTSLSGQIKSIGRRLKSYNLNNSDALEMYEKERVDVKKLYYARKSYVKALNHIEYKLIKLKEKAKIDKQAAHQERMRAQEQKKKEKQMKRLQERPLPEFFVDIARQYLDKEEFNMIFRQAMDQFNSANVDN